jgi:monofunctional biosynthetic peptidoglycan transglycosylase
MVRAMVRWTRLPWWIAVPVLLYAGLHVAWAAAFVALRFVNPFTTGVQIQRRLEALLSGAQYQKRSTWTPLHRISPQLQHAVIAAEDGNFYRHYGIDWAELQLVIEESRENGEPPRGASTITQQLVKNLFFTTHRNPVRKALEYTLAPMATLLLGRQRILELYLNVAEWGPGVWGAEAAARHHYGISAARLTREQAARLAACLPSPRRRTPARMDTYSAIIQDRMALLGW